MMIRNERGRVTMLKVNLLSHWGLLVLGGPLVGLSIVCLLLCGATCAIRFARRKEVWAGAAKPYLFLAILFGFVGGLLVQPVLPKLLALLW